MYEGGGCMNFEDVYKRYYRDVYYFLLSMSSNPELSEELTQETFYRALKNIHNMCLCTGGAACESHGRMRSNGLG